MNEYTRLKYTVPYRFDSTVKVKVGVLQQGRYKSRSIGTVNDTILLAALLTFLFSKV